MMLMQYAFYCLQLGLLSSFSISMIANFSSQRLETLKINFMTDVTEQSLIKLAKHCQRLTSVHMYGCTSVRNLEKIMDERPSFTIEMWYTTIRKCEIPLLKCEIPHNRNVRYLYWNGRYHTIEMWDTWHNRNVIYHTIEMWDTTQ